MSGAGPEALAPALLAGDSRALARAITQVEDARPGVEELFRAVNAEVGGAWRVGITGPPGAGKSTLVAALVKRFREQGAERVAVLAVDPSSPFTGGALLGDRVRMSSLALDQGVFIRSMATRGAFGGLARAAADTVDIMDAAGADPVIVETVGVGQSEVEIAGVADTTVVVLSPESGDGVQAMKAGILEVANVFAINKSDRDGADRIARDIGEMLHLAGEQGRWEPPVIKTVATDGTGVDELLAAMRSHQDRLAAGTGLRSSRLASIRRHVRDLVDATALRGVWSAEREEELTAQAEAVLDRRRTPWEAAASVLALGRGADVGRTT